MTTNPDEWMIDPAIPSNIRNQARARLMRKVANAQSAYQGACFYHELLQVNPHLKGFCQAQIAVQLGWANTNAREAALIAAEMGNTTEHTTTSAKVAWIDQQVEAAQFWAAETQVLQSRADNYNPMDAPQWVDRHITELIKKAHSLLTQGSEVLVALLPAVGQGMLAQPVLVKTEGGLEPLDLVDDRTTEQKLADGDLDMPPRKCKSCLSPLVLVKGKAHSYLHCTMCSDPARFYVLQQDPEDPNSPLYLDPNPPTTRAKKGTVS